MRDFKSIRITLQHSADPGWQANQAVQASQSSGQQHQIKRSARVLLRVNERHKPVERLKFTNSTMVSLINYDIFKYRTFWTAASDRA